MPTPDSEAREPNHPERTAWRLLHEIREAWEDATGTEPEQPSGSGPGRLRSMRYSPPIPDFPENIASALMSGPPKKRWSYEVQDEN